MDLRRISEPLTLDRKLDVVPLDAVKAQARIRHTDEDDLIKGYIGAAFDHLHGPDGWLNGYCLIEEEFEVFADGFGDTLELPLRPVDDLDAVAFEFMVADGTYASAAAGSFAAVMQSGFAVIARLSSTAFTRFGLPNNPLAFRARFKAGHALPTHVPEPLKQSIMLLAAHFYANREAGLTASQGGGTSREIEFGLKKLAGRYRVSPNHS